MTERPPCRLFVIPARDEAIAVIVRRGPSKWFHLILWDTRRDTFTGGAWFKGSLYPERCDLSRDGSLFVYLALKGDRAGTAFTHAWTAVSRPPWLHALALWPLGTTYGGGGRFVENRKLVLRCGEHVVPHSDLRPTNLQVVVGSAEYHTAGSEVPDADWSDNDHSGNLVFARRGQLFRRGKGKHVADFLLADFNNLTPEPTPAPDWAKRSL